MALTPLDVDTYWDGTLSTATGPLAGAAYFYPCAL